MAVRIPVYERHVQLDSGAQTIPRVGEPAPVGKAISSIGNSMMAIAAHWKAKQDAFEHMQMGQNVGMLKLQLQQIAYEEGLKFNPAVDPPGALHDRINARSQEAIAAFTANAPASLRKEYEVHGRTEGYDASVRGGHQESQARNSYGQTYLDKFSGTLQQSVASNPDSAHQAIALMQNEVKKTAAAGNISPGQQSIMLDGYLKAIGGVAIKSYQAQGRGDAAAKFKDEFVAARNAEDLAKVKSQINPAAYETKLTPDEEKEFQKWKAKVAPNDSGQDYDLRGAFKAGVEPDPQTGHMPDTFKKPNHPTFSNESQYAPQAPNLAGQWTGPNHDVFVPPTAAQAPAAAAAGPQSQLNQKRIDAINAKPEIKAIIEKAAADNGLDPNMLKVFASVESDGDPKQIAPNGKYKGLFQLGTAEFGMYNGGKGDVLNATDNANAAARLLKQNQEQLTTQLGRPPTFNELYLSHQQGMGGVTEHMKNPDQPAWQTMLSTGEGQQRIRDNGQASAEAWAKKAIQGNVPKDIVNRNFGGDSDKITSKEFMAIQGTRVQGGGVDQALAAARQPAGPQLAQGTVTASADGTVQSDTRPPAYVGNINIGGQSQVAARPLVTEAQRGSIRSQPISDATRNQLALAANETGVRVDVGSGGQPPVGIPGVTRTGSHRHDYGGAADVVLYDAQDGHKLDMTNPADQQKMGQFVTSAVKHGATGVGAGVDYMGPNAIHIGGGSAVAWGGPDARAVDAPPWLTAAHAAGMKTQLPPDQVATAAAALPRGPVQVAGPGVPQTGGGPVVGGSKWDQLGQSWQNQIDGGTLKAAAIQQSMKTSLRGRVASDVNDTMLNGTGAKLTPDLQKYYGTDTITYDLIANKLGVGEAIKWQQNKDYAEKVYHGGANLDEMPRDAILQRLNSIVPDPNSPYHDDQVKVFNAVLKKAQGIEKDRNSDPAGFADRSPAVQEARKALLSATDPADKEEKTRLFIEARMGQQRLMGIDPALQTPLSNQDAKVLSMPLLDRARANNATAPKEVADSVIRYIGKANAEGFSAPGEGTPDAPDLAHRALQTVLKSQKITNDQAAQTADALVTAQHPLPPALTPNQVKGPDRNNYYKYIAKDGYFVDPSGDFSAVYQPQPEPGDPGSDPRFGNEGKVEFQPGRKLIPGEHVKALLADPTLADIFDYGDGEKFPGYGAGASRHFLGGGSNSATSDPLTSKPNQPLPSEKQMPNIMVPRQPDILSTPDKTDQQDQQDQPSTEAPF